MRKFGIMLALALILVAAVPLQADNNMWMEGYGASTAMSLYNSQLVLSLTADAFGGKIYTKDKAAKIVYEQKALLGTLDKYLGKLLTEKQIPIDEKSYENISDCIKKLNATGDVLLKYISTPSQSTADDFQTKKMESYSAIAKFLKLK